MIHRSGPNKGKRKTIRDVLGEPYRQEAQARLKWWIEMLGIEQDDVDHLPFPDNAMNSVDGVNKAVAKKFGALIKQPAFMAKILGAKDE